MRAPWTTIAAASALFVSIRGTAWAARMPDIGEVAERLVPQFVAVGGAVVSGMAVAGILFVGLGFLKLKEAADTKGQQVGYGQGAWRLVVGSGLLAVPSLLGALQSTFGVSGSAVAAFFGS